MQRNHPATHGGTVLRMLIGAALAYAAALPVTDTHAGGTPDYSIDFYVISAGGSQLGNRCYRLSGTIGQAAPGFSSAQTYSFFAGYWQPSSGAAADDIFFNSFEAC